MTTGLNRLASYFRNVYPIQGPIKYHWFSGQYTVNFEGQEITVHPLFAAATNTLFKQDNFVLIQQDSISNKVFFFPVSAKKDAWDIFQKFLSNSCSDFSPEKNFYDFHFEKDALIISCRVPGNFQVTHYSSHVEKSLAFPDPYGNFSFCVSIHLYNFCIFDFYYEITNPEEVNVQNLSKSFSDQKTNQKIFKVLSSYYALKEGSLSSKIVESVLNDTNVILEMISRNLLNEFDSKKINVKVYYE